MPREGISTLYIHGTPREPFHLIVCLSFEISVRLIEEMRREDCLLFLAGSIEL